MAKWTIERHIVGTAWTTVELPEGATRKDALAAMDGACWDCSWEFGEDERQGHCISVQGPDDDEPVEVDDDGSPVWGDDEDGDDDDETIRALREDLAAERRAAVDAEEMRAENADGGRPWTAVARANVALDEAQSATDDAIDALAAAMDAPVLTADLRAALDALVEADEAATAALKSAWDAGAEMATASADIGRALDARDEAVAAIVAAYKAGAQ